MFQQIRIPSPDFYYILLIFLLIAVTFFAGFPNGLYPFLTESDYLAPFTYSVIFVMLIKWTITKSPIQVNINFFDIGLGLIFILIILGHFKNHNELQIIRQGKSLEIGLFVYFFARKISIKTSYIQSLFMFGMLCLGFTQILWGWLQLLNILPKFSNVSLISGSFTNAGSFANFIVLTLPYAILCGFYGLFTRNHKYNYFLILYTIIILTTIAFTKARISWISSIVVIVTFVQLKFNPIELIKRTFRRRYIRIVILFSAIILMILIFNLVYNFKKNSADGRLFVWNRTLEIIADNPWLGVGGGRFQFCFNKYQIDYFSNNTINNPWAELAQDGKFAYNDFLQMATEYGLIICLSFWGLLFFLVVLSLSRLKLKPTNLDCFYVSNLIGIIAFLVLSIASYPLQQLSTCLILFILIAFAVNSLDLRSIWKYSFNVSCSQIIKGLLILFTLILALHKFKNIQQRLDWHFAHNVWSKNEISEYKTLYTTLENNGFEEPEFLYNFGLHYFNKKEWKYCIEKLKLIDDKINTFDFHSTIGICYQKTHNYSKAEENLLNAHYLIPHKLTPMYQLVQLYTETNQPTKALAMARQIVNTPMKVYTPEGAQIKNEMMQYLEQNDTTSLHQ